MTNELRAKLQGIQSALEKLESEHNKGLIDTGRYLRLKVEYETQKAQLEKQLGYPALDQQMPPATLPGRLSASAQPRQAGLDTAALRAQLAVFDDTELDILCLDHFPQVYDKFSADMRRDRKINLLLDHCRRRPGESVRLLDLLA